jgi:hypothetical protein
VLWKVALVAVAIGAALVSWPAAAVERLYSEQIYATLQPLLTSASNLAPFALFDVLLVAASVTWVVLAAVDLGRRGWARAALRALVRTAVWGAAVYLVFLAAWGLNYRRTPLIEKLRFDPRAVTADAARRAATEAVEQVNALHAPAHRAGWVGAAVVEPMLAGGLAQAVGDLGGPSAIVVARPKATLLDWYFRRSGVEGMTDPFFLETLMADDLLPYERPFVVAHEWSHLAGIADEGEANFVGWLACLRGSPGDQYSGGLFLYGELARSLPPRDRATVAAGLAPGPRDDLRAVRARIAGQVSPRLSAAGWRVYDSYLRANRVEAGAASYAEVVRLVVGTTFAQGWRPVMR